jgi:hypothetical protein
MITTATKAGIVGSRDGTAIAYETLGPGTG